MPIELNGKVCLISGAAQGVGYGLARCFLKRGAIVVAGTRKKETPEGLDGALCVKMDVAEKEEDAALQLAQALGADVCLNSSKVNLPDVIEQMCPDGVDAVFECTGIPALIKPAMELCRVDGKFVWQGNYGDKPISFDFITAHGKRLKSFFPCDDGYLPCREAVIKHMTRGVVPWDKTVSLVSPLKKLRRCMLGSTRAIKTTSA